MNETNPKNQNRKRYRLHARLKKQGYQVFARQKLLLVPISLLESLSKQAKRLKTEFNYELQTVID